MRLNARVRKRRVSSESAPEWLRNSLWCTSRFDIAGAGPVAGVEFLHPHKPGKGTRNLDRRSPPDHSVVELIQGNSPRRDPLPHAERVQEHWYPRRLESALPVFPFFPP